jgi:hypothetical protein
MMSLGLWSLYCYVTLKLSFCKGGNLYTSSFMVLVVLCTLFTGSGDFVQKKPVYSLVLLVPSGKWEALSGEHVGICYSVTKSASKSLTFFV